MAALGIVNNQCDRDLGTCDMFHHFLTIGRGSEQIIG
jgi:hypothetical protein